MPSKGMCMTGWCVRALLEGRKTQTMRVIRPQPPAQFPYAQDCRPYGWQWTERNTDDDMMQTWPRFDEYVKAPHQPGDIVYVKEALRAVSLGRKFISYAANDERMLHDKWLWRWKRDCLPSRFMPREAARIWLRILDVDVRELCGLAESEYKAEGVDVTCGCPDPGCDKVHSYIAAFGMAWDDLHPKPGETWADNPWCFRYTFESVERPE